MKKKANLLPGLSLISQFGFTFIFGPVGLILSLPLAVVIFDRIRENLKSKEEGYNETIQLAVNESFRRTTCTSITTLIPLLSIILFGSYSLFWFSLSLSLGIVVGSYSSILLAPSLLLKNLD